MNNPPDHGPRDVGAPGLWTLLEAAHLLQERIETALESVGLSSAKHGVLRMLHAAGEPMPLGELASHARCVRSNMTQLIDRLEADGLVQRTNDPTDRRVVRAGLTDRGRELAVEGTRKLDEVQGAFTAGLGAAEQEALARILQSLR